MSKKSTFITQFNRNCEGIRKSNCVKFTKPSEVKESLSYATDINTIYENYCKTGRLPLNGNKPIYDENFINYDNLIEAQQAVKEASSYFANLPSDIRSKYGNKLENFVNAVHSQDNFLVEKGVLKLKEKDVPQPPVIPSVEPNIPVKPDVVTPVAEPVNTVTTDAV